MVLLDLSLWQYWSRMGKGQERSQGHRLSERTLALMPVFFARSMMTGKVKAVTSG